MIYMESDITFEAKMGDWTEADSGIMFKLIGAGNIIATYLSDVEA